MFEHFPGCFAWLSPHFRRRHLQHPSCNVAGEGHHDTGQFDKSLDAYGACCDFSVLDSDPLPPYYTRQEDPDIYIPDSGVRKTIEDTVDSIDPHLRGLSLAIHSHPETKFQEVYAHDVLTNYMHKEGFKVTLHYLGLKTAWRAEFVHGKGGRVIGVNSEMDALPGIGHACGHNLIAVSGVGVAVALKAAMEAHNISGKIVLLGTPAEENGGGKVILLERGGYKGMDACMMCHPAPGMPHSAGLGTTTALQEFKVEYFGHSAHAGSAPWEGTNALDAAFLAYSSISVLRQQTKPDHRVHGIVKGNHWMPNVIPDYAQMRWIIRAPTPKELGDFSKRVQKCFDAAALATSCEIKVTAETPYFNLNQNLALGQTFANIWNQLGLPMYTAPSSASTDFGNVSHELPSLHPSFAIPTEPNGGNHTPAFAVSAATPAAHLATMQVTKCLALTAVRILSDEGFFTEVKRTFDESKHATAAA